MSSQEMGRQDQKELLQAVASDDVSKLEILKARGVDFNALLDSVGATPIQIAVSDGSWKAANYLAENGADVNKEDKFGTLIWNYRNYDGFGSGTDLDKIHGLGADPKLVSSNGRSLLRCLVSYGAEQDARRLLIAGADPLQKLSEGWSLVAEAAAADSPGMVKLLAEYGVPYDHGKDESDWRSPLAVAIEGGSEETVSALLEMGGTLTDGVAVPGITSLEQLLLCAPPPGADDHMFEYAMTEILKQQPLQDLMKLAKSLVATRRIMAAHELTVDDVQEHIKSNDCSNRHHLMDAIISHE